MSIEARPSDEFAALLGGAVTLSRVGDRVAAIAALLSAVGLAPDDLTAHRRLAAAYAVAGDRECARREYDRFIARLERRGALDAAAIERSYAAMLFSPQPSPQRAIGAPARRRLTTDQAFALRRIGIAVIAIAFTVTAMLVVGAQIFASGGPV